MVGTRVGLRVGLLIGSYVLAILLYIWLRPDSLLPSLLAILFIGFIALRLNDALWLLIENEANPSSLVVASLAGVGIFGVGLFVWSILGGPSGVGFFGFALLYLCAGVALALLRSGSLPGVPLAAVLGACTVLVLAGLVVVAVGGGAWWWKVTALGLLASPLGLSLISENALRYLVDHGWVWSASLVGIGSAVMVLTLVLVALSAPNTYVLALGIALVVIMLAVAARSNVDVVLVVALVAVVWAMTQRSVPLPDALEPEAGDRVMVALGDSFISGEGADEYFADTNTPDQSTCRRAPTAYPALLMLEHSADIPEHLAFQACSGATADEVGRLDDAETADGVDADNPTQLDDLLDTVDADDVDLVAVMVGGNDSLFGTIARSCLLPIDCTPLEQAWRDNLRSVGQTLDDLYDQIRSSLPDARVVVVPYPVPITEDRVRCGYSAFSRDEHKLLYNFTLALNATVTAAAERADFEVVDTMPTAFRNTQLRLCDAGAGDVGVNFLAANSVTGTIEQSVDPRNWIHNSMHPNARGHEAMRGAFVSWIEGGDEPEPFGPPDSPESTRNACVNTFGDELDQCTKDWIGQKTSQKLLTKGWFVLPAVVGAWFLALGLVGLGRFLLDTRPQAPTTTPHG
jgi:lysophospholipase L1-like esterase